MDQPIRRRPRRKKRNLNAKQLLIAGCVIGAVALVVAACLIFPGPGEEEGIAVPTVQGQAAVDMPALTVNGLHRDGETMVVDTSYMDVAFPYAFSDLIGVEAVNQEEMAALEFRAKIGGGDRKLYTVWFNNTQGQSVGTYDLQNGEAPVCVTVVFYDPPAELGGDDRVTFFATQETFNDVLASMKEDGNFSVQS